MAHCCTTASFNVFAAILTTLILASSGCRRTEPVASDKASAAGVSASQAAFLNTALGADKDDDPKSPRALAKTGDVPDWVKTRPVRLADPGRLSDLVSDPALLEPLKTGRPGSIASCRYNNQNTSAEVLFVQTPTSADAFGLLGMLTPQPGQLNRSDRSIRASHSDGASIRMVAQQGSVCICMDVSGRVELETVQRSARRLMDFIVFSLPAGDPPILMQLLPEADKIWFVSQTDSLAKVDNPLVRRLTPAAVFRTLRLGGDTGLWIAAMPSSGNQPAHLIWMVGYTNPADAAATHTGCLTVAREKLASMGLHTAVMEPKGVRLVGVWSEQPAEAAALLKRLHDTLP